MEYAELEQLLTITEVAELFGTEPRIVRREARKDTIPGTIKVLGKFGFDPDKVKDWVPPEPGTRTVGAKREDGRRRYRVYLSEEEATKLKAEGYELVDPREAAKQRRVARKAAKAAKVEGTSETAAETGEGDPFADFG